MNDLQEFIREVELIVQEHDNLGRRHFVKRWFLRRVIMWKLRHRLTYLSKGEYSHTFK